MSGSRRRKKTSKPIGEQVLSMDYWEGFYASGPDIAVELTDMSQSSLGYTIYRLSDGKVLKQGTMDYREESTLSSVNMEISDVCPSGLTLRLSDSVETPDRHAELQRLMEEGDRFQLFRVRDLIRRLLSKGIIPFGGPIGEQDLYDADYEGFYMMEDGNILYCRDSMDWDPSKTGCIADGAVSYWVVDPSSFSLPPQKEQLYGFLRGDRFAEFAESLYSKHGRVRSCIGKSGDELFSWLMDAAEGDSGAAARASHRLRITVKPAV